MGTRPRWCRRAPPAPPGIPAALRSRVFDRFFTTDADRSGTGLGLAIVETVVRDPRGEVGLCSNEGQGTEVRVTLPAA